MINCLAGPNVCDNRPICGRNDRKTYIHPEIGQSAVQCGVDLVVPQGLHHVGPMGGETVASCRATWELGHERVAVVAGAFWGPNHVGPC